MTPARNDHAAALPIRGSIRRQGGFEGARQLLARPHRPTAVFAGADIVAMGVLEAFAEAGVSVPDDISVAGYDNTTFASFGPISLTSVDQAGHEIGANAARLLVERIADRLKPPVQIKLSPTLVPRRTPLLLRCESSEHRPRAGPWTGAHHAVARRLPSPAPPLSAQAGLSSP
jgi:DNA-binding LacI/PurR family transcriptional regulator